MAWEKVEKSKNVTKIHTFDFETPEKKKRV